jgi:hypothetical protein
MNEISSEEGREILLELGEIKDIIEVKFPTIKKSNSRHA